MLGCKTIQTCPPLRLFEHGGSSGLTRSGLAEAEQMLTSSDALLFADLGAIGMKTFRKEDIVGKPVIETSGTMKGKVKDVTFDLSGGITLIVEGADGKDSQVPIGKVTGISDDVVVRSEGSLSAASSPGTCKFCGKPIAPDQTWCPSCGKSQA